MIDQLHRKVILSNDPLRIVSVVPSQTELLFDLGLSDEVVGITKFCIHPSKWFKYKQRVGGTKNLNLELIDQLNPTLIIANKEENEKKQIDVLATKYPVYISDIETTDDALVMIKQLGILVNKETNAIDIIDHIQSKIHQLFIQKTTLRVLYLIWYDPIMVAGTDTFIHNMLKIAGFENAIVSPRYPTISKDEIIQLNPDIVFLSSEPFPFKKKHKDELQCFLPQATIKFVDGELFSWYGSRMLKSFEYFRVLNEELV